MSEKIVPALRTSPLLSALTDDQMQRLASIAAERHFDPGDKLIEEGSTGAMALWVVLDGEVEVRRGDTVIRTFGSGAHIGEMAVLADSDAPRTADVVAASDVTAIRIAKWDLFTQIKANPDVAIAIISELARRLEKTTALAAGE